MIEYIKKLPCAYEGFVWPELVSTGALCEELACAARCISSASVIFNCAALVRSLVHLPRH
jgi:hypothetical protein